MIRVLPVLGIALLGLGACTTTAPSPTPGPVASSASSPSPSSTAASPGPPSSTSSTVPVAAAGDVPAGYPAREVCDFLTGQVPALQGITTPVGRQANLTGNLFTFFQDHAVVPDGAALDAATAASCPQVRTTVLGLLGLPSLARL